MNLSGVHLVAERAAKTQPLAGQGPYRKVTSFGLPEMRLPSEAASVIGRHRFAEADIVVAPVVSILHDVVAMAADVDVAVYCLYNVSTGQDVTTNTHMSVVQGTSRTHTRPALPAPRPAAEAEGALLC